MKRRTATLRSLFELGREGNADARQLDDHELNETNNRTRPSIRGPEDVAGRLAGLGSHRQLMAALEQALEPTCGPTMLAVFDLGGFDAYLNLYGHIAAEELLAGLSSRLVETLGGSASLYRPRYNELVALLAGVSDAAESALNASVAKLNGEFAGHRIALSFGAAGLPDEAVAPIDAMLLADTRLFLHAHARRARERGSATGRPAR